MIDCQLDGSIDRRWGGFDDTAETERGSVWRDPGSVAVLFCSSAASRVAVMDSWTARPGPCGVCAVHEGQTYRGTEVRRTVHVGCAGGTAASMYCSMYSAMPVASSGGRGGSGRRIAGSGWWREEFLVVPTVLAYPPGTGTGTGLETTRHADIEAADTRSNRLARCRTFHMPTHRQREHVEQEASGPPRPTAIRGPRLLAARTQPSVRAPARDSSAGAILYLSGFLSLCQSPWGRRSGRRRRTMLRLQK